MSPGPQRPAAENPFSTRCVRPGAAPFLFPLDLDADRLVDRLRANGWWGQIVGPHGSGKSALLATLIPAIQKAGSVTRLFELHDSQRRLPCGISTLKGIPRPAVLVVDGYEQLDAWGRFRLRAACRRCGLGLLVTAHASSGFPDLVRTAPSLQTARRIVEQLLPDSQSIVLAGDIERAFARCQGNLREVLFDLYDLYERHRPTAP